VTEALRTLLQFGFETLGLHRIKGTADAGNLASRRVLEKCGMRYEGVCRREGWRDQPEDTAHYALLRQEWTGALESPFEPVKTAFTAVPVALMAQESGDGNPYFEIKTPHLRLREFREGDWEALEKQSFVPITKIGRHPLNPQNGLEERNIRDYVHQTMQKSRECPRHLFSFVATSHEDSDSLGAATLSIAEDNRTGWVVYHANFELLQSGFAAEALAALLHLGFRQLGVERIATDCWADEAASIEVFSDSGMQQEACFLESVPAGEKWRSFYSYAALSEDWKP
jgi:RimJ/RimL family protein N-acetyltransferase